MTELTRKVLAYRNSGEGFSELVQELCLLTYRYPERKYGWDEDTCGDFFCSMYHRIPGFIERFEFKGIPFDSFFYTSLSWQMKTFYKKQKARRAYERVVAEPLFWSVREPEEPYLIDQPEDIPRHIRSQLRIDENGRIQDRASCIRVLCMTLRNSESVDGSMVLRISRLCGCSQEWLHACVLHLKERLNARRIILERLRARRNGIFLKICLLHDELNLETDRLHSRILMEQIETEKARLSRITSKIRRYPFYPTHREIGQVLGLPKGTVDSGLYYLKNNIKSLS